MAIGSRKQVVEVPYAELASHEVSPEDHPKALLRLSRAEGKALVLTILEATPDRAYATLCDAKLAITACIRRRRRRGEQQPVPEHKKQPTAKRAEVMRRAKLLQTDEALQKRHKELSSDRRRRRGGVLGRRDGPTSARRREGY